MECAQPEGLKKYTTGAWSLGDLAEDPAGLEQKMRSVQRRAKKFESHRDGLDPQMGKDRFCSILADLEDIYERLGVIGGYASLGYAANTQSDSAAALLSRVTKLGADISNQILFFDLWWKRKIDAHNAERLSAGSDQLRNYLRHKRLLARHSLGESEERIINTLDVTGPSALVKLYDRITNSFEYTVRIGGRKKKLGREQLTELVRSPAAGTRKAAYRSLLGRFATSSGVLGEIYRNIILNWRDEGVELRKYESPISVRNAANDLGDGAVSALLDACRNNSGVFRGLFRAKAKLLGLDKLRRYDLYAPVRTRHHARRYPYDKAVRLVLDSLAGLSPELADHARAVFERHHVDSGLRPGKRDGAFCSTPSPKLAPYVLLSFAGSSRDVFTLAHEMGHAVHSMAASSKSVLVQEAQLPLAETASTFSELLLYERLSESAEPDEMQAMLAEKLDDLYATVMRQSYFTIFESEAHAKIAAGATVEELSESYLKGLADQFGRSVDVSSDFGVEWSCIPHFYHAPFYCYAYSFGNLLALSLFRRLGREPDFARSYVEILSAGGSQKPEDLLGRYGLDITSRGFWQDGFDYIDEQVRRLRKLV